MIAGDRLERGPYSAALGLLLAIGIVGIALGADGRPAAVNAPPPAGEWTISATATSSVADSRSAVTGAEQFGSCCYSDGSCAVTLELNCTGFWTLSGVCEPNTCEQPPVGACCDFATGNCVVTTQAACSFGWLGPDVPCLSWTCPSPGATGACCRHDTGGCTITYHVGCQFDWLGVGVPCTPVTCPMPDPVGACCYPPYDLCVVVTHAACDSLSGYYFGDSTTCEPLPCPVRGACCLSATECVLAYPWNCTDQGGIYQGDAHPCDPNPCLPPVPVERTSWGRLKGVYR